MCLPLACSFRIYTQISVKLLCEYLCLLLKSATQIKLKWIKVSITVIDSFSLIFPTVGVLVMLLHNNANLVFLTCSHSSWAHHPISSLYLINWVRPWPFQELLLSHFLCHGAAPLVVLQWQRKLSLPFREIRDTKVAKIKCTKFPEKHSKSPLSAVCVKCFTLSIPEAHILIMMEGCFSESVCFSGNCNLWVKDKHVFQKSKNGSVCTQGWKILEFFATTLRHWFEYLE